MMVVVSRLEVHGIIDLFCDFWFECATTEFLLFLLNAFQIYAAFSALFPFIAALID